MSKIDEILLRDEKAGEEMLASGAVNGKQLYSARAKKYGLKFVDLYEEPCQRDILSKEDRHDYIRYGAIPWKKRNEKISVALNNLRKDTIDWVKIKFGKCQILFTSPFDIKHVVNTNFKTENIFEACDGLWWEDPARSAKQLFRLAIGSTKLKLLAGAMLTIFFAALFFVPFFVAVNCFYFLTLLFKTIVFCVGWNEESKKEKREWVHLPDNQLPIYTILVPLYKEKAGTISQLINAIRNLNYPKARLDVKLITEEDDFETIQNIKNLRCERIFDIIEVPFSYPRTKPKALNYALKFARGEFVTIYDAEDKPEPDQLREAVSRFRNGPKNLACLQGRLNYYNREENLITRMFSFEYGSWFDFLLPGLEKLKIPMPLGGTSNHFPLTVLKQLHAWDPYNVTEDADLGIRLAAKGYKSEILNSRTLEESPINIKSWLRQRSRWIKGHMQTYIVHTRKNNGLYENAGLQGRLGFLFFLGAPCWVFFTLPFVLISAGVMIFSGAGFPEWFLGFSMINLYSAILLHMFYATVVVVRNKWWKDAPYSLAFPFYWVLHSVASFKAVWQLIVDPHYWEKTEHGLTKLEPQSICLTKEADLSNFPPH